MSRCVCPQVLRLWAVLYNQLEWFFSRHWSALRQGSGEHGGGETRHRFCWWPVLSKAHFMESVLQGCGVFDNHFPSPSIHIHPCLLHPSSLTWARVEVWWLTNNRSYAYLMPQATMCPLPQVDTTWQRWVVSMWATDKICSRVGTDESFLLVEALDWISWDKNHFQQVTRLIWVHRQIIYFLYVFNTLPSQCLHMVSSQKRNQDNFHHHHSNVLSCTTTRPKAKWLKVPVRNLWK